MLLKFFSLYYETTTSDFLFLGQKKPIFFKTHLPNAKRRQFYDGLFKSQLVKNTFTF